MPELTNLQKKWRPYTLYAIISLPNADFPQNVFYFKLQ